MGLFLRVYSRVSVDGWQCTRLTKEQPDALAPTTKDLNHSPRLRLSADDRIELSLPRQRRDIDARLFKRLARLALVASSKDVADSSSTTGRTAWRTRTRRDEGWSREGEGTRVGGAGSVGNGLKEEGGAEEGCGGGAKDGGTKGALESAGEHVLVVSEYVLVVSVVVEGERREEEEVQDRGSRKNQAETALSPDTHFARTFSLLLLSRTPARASSTSPALTQSSPIFATVSITSHSLPQERRHGAASVCLGEDQEGTDEWTGASVRANEWRWASAKASKVVCGNGLTAAGSGDKCVFAYTSLESLPVCGGTGHSKPYLHGPFALDPPFPFQFPPLLSTTARFTSLPSTIDGQRGRQSYHDRSPSPRHDCSLHPFSSFSLSASLLDSLARLHNARR